MPYDEDIARQKFGDAHPNALSCPGKERYSSAVDAGKAKQAIARRHHTRAGMHVYRCECADAGTSASR